jgi:hypothetical protein
MLWVRTQRTTMASNLSGINLMKIKIQKCLKRPLTKGYEYLVVVVFVHLKIIECDDDQQLL